MNSWHNQSTKLLCKAILSLKTEEEVYAFLDDICTVKETIDISQRMWVAWLLSQKENYSSISKTTGASTTTISRVNKCYEYGNGGYKTVISRLSEEK